MVIKRIRQLWYFIIMNRMKKVSIWIYADVPMLLGLDWYRKPGSVRYCVPTATLNTTIQNVASNRGGWIRTTDPSLIKKPL